MLTHAYHNKKGGKGRIWQYGEIDAAIAEMNAKSEERHVFPEEYKIAADKTEESVLEVLMLKKYLEGENGKDQREGNVVSNPHIRGERTH